MSVSKSESSDVLSATELVKCPTCGGDAIDRTEFFEAAPDNGAELLATLHKVRKAVENYYLALDRRKHGDVAANRAMNRIESALGMRWVQLETTKFLEANPKLKPFYDQD